MNIRVATANNFKELYEIGLAAPELKVSANEAFMDQDEFLSAIENPNGVFLLAEDGEEVIGFIYVNRKDIEQKLEKHWACLVYLVVKPKHRKRGVAQALYDACIKELKKYNITNVYVWANVESDGSIVSFMNKNGFSEGHRYMWMDKEI